MRQLALSYALILAMAGVVSACDQTRVATPASYEAVEYVSANSELIGDGLVKVSASVKNAQSDKFASDFAACVAARYALLRGFGFARLVTDTVTRSDDIRTATSVFSISARLPAGVRKLDAEVVAVNCAENGIPMV